MFNLPCQGKDKQLTWKQICDIVTLLPLHLTAQRSCQGHQRGQVDFLLDEYNTQSWAGKHKTKTRVKVLDNKTILIAHVFEHTTTKLQKFSQNTTARMFLHTTVIRNNFNTRLISDTFIQWEKHYKNNYKVSCKFRYISVLYKHFKCCHSPKTHIT